jgi:putative ABC transport system substrate-binding protein
MSGFSRRTLLRGAIATSALALGGGLAASCQRPLGAATAPRAAAPLRLGFLALTSADDYAPYLDAFRAGLTDLGYVEGRSVQIDTRFAMGREEQLAVLAADLVRRQVDVLVSASTQATLAAIEVTRTTPIVFFNSGDPVGSGLVSSLARPSGNATGLTSLNRELAGKRLELLRLAAPSVNRVAVLWADAAERDVNEIRSSGFWLGLQVEAFRVSDPDSLDESLQKALASRPDALVAVSSPLINSLRDRITDFTSDHRLASISELGEFVESGGLLAYGANLADLARRAATYVDKIVAGARPAELPVERAERFELAVNLRTAQRLGLLLPTPLLLQATEVIS